MEIPLLINKTDIEQYRQISDVDDDILNPFIKEAQFLDLQDILGADFYNDLLRNYTDAIYQDLLDGGSYTYNSKTYSNIGLKAVLVFYAYARYIKDGSKIDTPFSFVEKTNEFSTPVSTKDKMATYKSNQQIAFKYWMNVKAFLNRNSTTYPEWENECMVPENKGMRFSKII